jgi:hypothetical protein
MAATEFKNNQILESQASIDYNLRDVYDHMNASTDASMDYDKFKKIFRSLSKAIIEFVLEGYLFKFPYNLGILRIKKRKMTLNKKMLRVNFAETKRLGKTIYHLNEHSSGYYYKFYWDRGIISGIRKYSFTPVRIHKRALAKKILEEQKDYA